VYPLAVKATRLAAAVLALGLAPGACTEKPGEAPEGAAPTTPLEALERATVRATSALAGPVDVAAADAAADALLAAATALPPADTGRAARALAAWIGALAVTAPVGSGAERVRRADALAARMAASPALAAEAPGLASREAGHRALAARIDALAAAALRERDYDKLTRLDGLLDALAAGVPGAPAGGDAGARALRGELLTLRDAIYGPAHGTIRLGVERFELRADGAGVDAIVWLRREAAPGLPPITIDPRAIRMVAVGGVFDPIPPAKPTRKDLGGTALAAQGEVSGRLTFPLPPAGAEAIRALAYTPPGGLPAVERALPRPAAPRPPPPPTDAPAPAPKDAGPPPPPAPAPAPDGAP
jgi:hypothetical protein